MEARVRVCLPVKFALQHLWYGEHPPTDRRVGGAGVSPKMQRGVAAGTRTGQGACAESMPGIYTGHGGVCILTCYSHSITGTQARTLQGEDKQDVKPRHTCCLFCRPQQLGSLPCGNRAWADIQDNVGKLARPTSHGEGEDPSLCFNLTHSPQMRRRAMGGITRPQTKREDIAWWEWAT